ncbi:hypothetical protein RvY_11222 [Ramazzottius varieornatus]|uniref:Uncharacterized protein n=1 Tax=Ramazzottius varieornatus TaxID=947166 RepID=A0A1D1VFF7_RAMVA|nr:hypothetical protein RvY_11222 [Ramazzottius varieornatus]
MTVPHFGFAVTLFCGTALAIEQSFFPHDNYFSGKRSQHLIIKESHKKQVENWHNIHVLVP